MAPPHEGDFWGLVVQYAQAVSEWVAPRVEVPCEKRFAHEDLERSSVLAEHHQVDDSALTCREQWELIGYVESLLQMVKHEQRLRNDAETRCANLSAELAEWKERASNMGPDQEADQINTGNTLFSIRRRGDETESGNVPESDVSGSRLDPSAQTRMDLGGVLQDGIEVSYLDCITGWFTGILTFTWTAEYGQASHSDWLCVLALPSLLDFLCAPEVIHLRASSLRSIDLKALARHSLQLADFSRSSSLIAYAETFSRLSYDPDRAYAMLKSDVEFQKAFFCQWYINFHLHECELQYAYSPFVARRISSFMLDVLDLLLASPVGACRSVKMMGL
ncbi:unnamed protein product [Symbiodinium sp. CCMP2592]|nr:unnamed protein product [Symbiodinium sp. CCMP2592]